MLSVAEISLVFCKGGKSQMQEPGVSVARADISGIRRAPPSRVPKPLKRINRARILQIGVMEVHPGSDSWSGGP